MPKKITKLAAVVTFSIIALPAWTMASEWSGTLAGARSTDSMTTYRGTLAANTGTGGSNTAGAGENASASSGGNGSSSGGGGSASSGGTSGSTGSTGGSGGGSDGSSGGSTGGEQIIILDGGAGTAMTDNIFIVSEGSFAGTGGGYSPEAESLIASAEAESGIGSGSAAQSTAQATAPEELLALNVGAAEPQYLGGDQAAAAARSSLGLGTIALIALGTIALVAAIGYGVNAALSIKNNDRL